MAAGEVGVGEPEDTVFGGKAVDKRVFGPHRDAVHLGTRLFVVEDYDIVGSVCAPDSVVAFQGEAVQALELDLKHVNNLEVVRRVDEVDGFGVECGNPEQALVVVPLDAVDAAAVWGAPSVDGFAGVHIALDDVAEVGVGAPVGAGDGGAVGTGPDVSVSDGDAGAVLSAGVHRTEDVAGFINDVDVVRELVHHE